MIRELAEKLAAIPPESCGGRCNQAIYEDGRLVVMLHGPRASVIEGWVREVARVSKKAVDWHMAGGYARVLTLEPVGVVDQVARDLFPALDMVYKDGQEDEPITQGSVYSTSVRWPDGA